MRLSLIILLLTTFQLRAQNTINLQMQQDSVSGNYGYVNEKGDYIIKPIFNSARNFISEYTSVQKDSLWGIIDTNGTFVVKPKYSSRISGVYRGHFLEYGENYKFRSLNGEIKYEYLFIPGPFKEIEAARDTLDYSNVIDAGLLNRILEMQPRLCHYYITNRMYNGFTHGNDWVTIQTIDYVLNNPETVKKRIVSCIEFEKAYDRGEIGCCGQGAYWWDE